MPHRDANGRSGGAIVDSDGLKLLHKGDKVIAAADAVAQLSEDEGPVVVYQFPVEIEVRSAADSVSLLEVAELIDAALAGTGQRLEIV